MEEEHLSRSPSRSSLDSSSSTSSSWSLIGRSVKEEANNSTEESSALEEEACLGDNDDLVPSPLTESEITVLEIGNDVPLQSDLENFEGDIYSGFDVDASSNEGNNVEDANKDSEDTSETENEAGSFFTLMTQDVCKCVECKGARVVKEFATESEAEPDLVMIDDDGEEITSSERCCCRQREETKHALFENFMAEMLCIVLVAVCLFLVIYLWTLLKHTQNGIQEGSLGRFSVNEEFSSLKATSKLGACSLGVTKSIDPVIEESTGEKNRKKINPKSREDSSFLNIAKRTCSKAGEPSDEETHCSWSHRQSEVLEVTDNLDQKTLEALIHGILKSKSKQKLNILTDKAKSSVRYVKKQLKNLKANISLHDVMDYLITGQPIIKILEQMKVREQRAFRALQSSLARLESFTSCFHQKWKSVLRWPSSCCSKGLENRYQNLNYDCIALIELANAFRKDELLQNHIGGKNAKEYLNSLYDISSCTKRRVDCERCFWTGNCLISADCSRFSWQKKFDVMDFFFLHKKVLKEPFLKLGWRVKANHGLKLGSVEFPTKQGIIEQTVVDDIKTTTAKISSGPEKSSVIEEKKVLDATTTVPDVPEQCYSSKGPVHNSLSAKRRKLLEYWERLANLESTREYALREWAAEVLKATQVEGIKLRLSLRVKIESVKWRNTLDYWEHLVNEESTREYALNKWIEEALKVTKKGTSISLKVYPFTDVVEKYYRRNSQGQPC